MTTYNEIAGRRVNFLSSDPTYVDTNSNGQVWYNSSTATLKSWLPTGAWISGGNMNTARGRLASAGTQTAALGAGGYVPGNTYTNVSEAYNGIAWTNTPSLNTTRGYVNIGAVGTQTAAAVFGGYTGTAISGATENYNGSTWTTSGSLNTTRYGLGGAGIQTAA